MLEEGLKARKACTAIQDQPSMEASRCSKDLEFTTKRKYSPKLLLQHM